MHSNDLPALYERCIARNGDEYADNAARELLADLAADIVGLVWGRSGGWCDADECEDDGLSPEEYQEWVWHGRRAPLVSADCALSIPWPSGYDWVRRLDGRGEGHEICVAKYDGDDL